MKIQSTNILRAELAHSGCISRFSGFHTSTFIITCHYYRRRLLIMSIGTASERVETRQRRWTLRRRSIVENGRGVSLPSRLEVCRVNYHSSIRGRSRLSALKHFGVFLVVQTFLISAIFTILVQERSVEIIVKLAAAK